MLAMHRNILFLSLFATTLIIGTTASGIETENTGTKHWTQPCNCTEWSCPRTSGLFCHPGPFCKHKQCNPMKAPNGYKCIPADKCQIGPPYKCVDGICMGKYELNCPRHPVECKAYKCVSSTGKCTDVVNQPNGTSCTGGTCKDGECIPTKPCKRNPNPCKKNVYDSTLKKCIETDAKNGTRCNDKDKCTSDDVCMAGMCTGQPRTCLQPAAQCKMSECDSGLGRCKVSNKPNGTPCSRGKCQNGVCKGDTPTCPNTNPCVSSTWNGQKCVKKPINENGACDDGSLCTTGDKCKAGKCTGTPKVCNVTNECRQNATCNPLSGVCQDEKKPDNTPCTDGKCSDGVCIPETPPICIPTGNPCTNNTWDGAKCVEVPINENSACDDGKFCTTGDKCVVGVCTGTPKTDCSASSECKANPRCSTAEDTCIEDDKPDNTPCSIGTCQSGVCTPPSNCTQDPTNVCVANVLINGACVAQNRSGACTDYNACTLGDMCENGVCKPGEQKECTPTGECKTNARCESGNCVQDNKSDGTKCSFGTCQSGSCTPPAECTPSTNVCQLNISCGGVCFTTNVPGSCEDGDACTIGDTCYMGACKPGAPKVCIPPECKKTVGCNHQTGDCIFENKADGNTCSVGTCQGGVCTPPAGCDQPTDVCKCSILIGGVCTTVPKSGSCDDGDACTIGDMCEKGDCMPGPVKDCQPTGECKTNARCANGACLEENVADGTPCSESGTCQNGVCDQQAPPATCTSDGACGPNRCCCTDNGVRVCREKVGDSCAFTCGDYECQKGGKGSGLDCHCIKDCKGDGCSSLFGNTCPPTAVCCCAKPNDADNPGKNWGEVCTDCATSCNRNKQSCVGDLPKDKQEAICKAPAKFPDV